MTGRGRPARTVDLDEKQRVELERRVRASTSTQREARRARIILGCNQGGSAASVGRRVGVSSRTVERWRARFMSTGLDGLADAPRAGHKSKFGPVTRLELIALACDPVRPRDGKPTVDELVQVVRGTTVTGAERKHEDPASQTTTQGGTLEALVREAAALSSAAAAAPAGITTVEELAAPAAAIGAATVTVPSASKITRTITELVEEAVARGIVDTISWSSYQRLLAAVDLRPHLVEGWVHSPDPQFREKVTAICELYLRPPPGAVVLSVDEKTGMQALARRFPDRPARPGRKRRREFEYQRHGTQSLLCAFEVRTGRVVAACGATRTGQDLVAFMEQVATAYPTQPVHVIWDNLNIHFDGDERRWTAFNARHGHRFVFHYTPKHASWVNQVECFFSLVQRYCLRDRSFASTDELRATVLAFIAKWNEQPRPFRWTFTGYPLQTGGASLPLAA